MSINSGIVLNLRLPKGDCLKVPACPAKEKTLSQMNMAGMPPPGSSGSPFKAMEYPPPSYLPPQSPSQLLRRNAHGNCTAA